MSMTKSTVRMLAEILTAEGRLDDAAPVTDYLPELADTAFGTATVRQVMDMTTSLVFDENYDDPNADIWAHSAAGSLLPKQPGYDGHIGYIDYLQTVEQDGEHGAAFGYKTVNTDVLAWIVARVTGMPYHQALSERLWSRMGAEGDAYFTVDAAGTHLCRWWPIGRPAGPGPDRPAAAERGRDQRRAPVPRRRHGAGALRLLSEAQERPDRPHLAAGLPGGGRLPDDQMTRIGQSALSLGGSMPNG
jgi:CubicO group peptidase (beta-lactamase class C family)